MKLTEAQVKDLIFKLRTSRDQARKQATESIKDINGDAALNYMSRADAYSTVIETIFQMVLDNSNNIALVNNEDKEFTEDKVDSIMPDLDEENG